MPYWQPFQHTCRAMRTLQSGVSDKQCGDLTAELLVSNVSSPSGLLISATVSSGLPGERWTLAISTESGHRWSTYPVDGNSTLTTHLPASRAESRTYTLQACRVGSHVGYDEAIDPLYVQQNIPHSRPSIVSSNFRKTRSECEFVGLCTARRRVVVPNHQRAATADRPCCSLLLNAGQEPLSLASGWWVPGNDSARGDATFEHQHCSMPTLDKMQLHLQRGATTGRVLFVGDSTIEEQALMLANSAGYAFSELNLRCPNASGSRYREFDAVGRSLEISMRWSVGGSCNGNHESLPPSASWRAALVSEALKLRPAVVVFSLPAVHMITACLLPNWKPGDNRERKACDPLLVQSAVGRYVRFMSDQVAMPSNATLVLASTGHSNKRDSWCNAELWQLHRWGFEALGVHDAELKMHGRIAMSIHLDSFAWAFSYDDHAHATSYLPNNKLTCACTVEQEARIRISR